ncbi:twitching motility protein PilT [Candidatus Brocadia sapporoensis]|uniref:Twitching motility protein PilT n=1 Tax=Candidatus Brocadia sapporoensis TaxID=392547 RepID=A0A1V6LZ59_9BACT|nr:type IV pilus twitching motility protein PilT [Candidatus Brocadia sapporoensis]MDG6005702.1 type IV pilus twitching motility protein PilT [Candidatus Brocadia sp.]RZV58014.1 MAG: type IV pilus twitching motility protein PilT [Candidatus Brocadia sp. BROELEC01]TWU52766.1 Type II/IV secretion system protein [Candidatus Brocadiaceae bacterium B188]MBW7898125.1 type IV pilus twitching motility protein PilT [Candidatus Brocadia sapporoensis]OQD45387.1 twitching motility protein PilT [Candidatus
MEILELLTFAKKENASDIHISSGEPPIIRIHGDVRKLDIPPLSNQEVHSMLYGILTDRHRKDFEEHHELDFSIQYGDMGRFRVNAFIQSRGESIVFRTIPTVIPTLEQLNMPKIVGDLTKKEKGLVLVTGPTGSGKSTTLAAMIDLINREQKCHILTVEDPIEFMHRPKTSLVNQRELGSHTHSFANALRSALREDPDIILVGEMRDLETISLALTAAETGHLVFGTLHTSSAPKTVDRIVDVFPPNQQEQVRTMFSESLQAVITQQLVKKKDGTGRIAALEIMTGTPAVRNLIRENKIAQIPSAIQTGRQYGMQTMDQSLIELCQKGTVARETIETLVSSPSVLSGIK